MYSFLSLFDSSLLHIIYFVCGKTFSYIVYFHLIPQENFIYLKVENSKVLDIKKIKSKFIVEIFADK